MPLVLQPDFGQTMLVSLVWCGLFFVAGLHWFWVIGLGGIGAIGILVAYELVPHVRARIERFMDKGSGDTFQVDTALESFAQGGWLGKGPGEGTVKRILPDAHTDFIFAVTAEEFGILVCMLLVALFAAIVIRSLFVAQKAEDPFIRLAVTGLALLFGIQAAINMMVNLHMMPAKGMTLPFISYGGSSLLSLGDRHRLPAGADPAQAALGRFRLLRTLNDGSGQARHAGRRRDRRPSLPGRGAEPRAPCQGHARRADDRYARAPSSPAASRPRRCMPCRRRHRPAARPSRRPRRCSASPRASSRARRIIAQVKPAVVVGFGGYPTVPPVLGASLAGVRTLIHEQNAVIGRANRFLAGRADVIATGFAKVGGLTEAQQAKCRHVGNPVRPAVIEAAGRDYDWPGEGRIQLLVFGGSQGARIMARHRAAGDPAPDRRRAGAAGDRRSRRGQRTTNGCAASTRSSA